LSKLYDINRSSLSHYYIDITSDFAKDKKVNWGKGIYENIAEVWRVDEKNIGEVMNLDEKNIQKGEVYTILSNPKTDKLTTILPWTKADVISTNIKYSMSDEARGKVKEVVTDMSSSMESIVKQCFPKAIITTDRFHVMKNVLEDLLAVRTRTKTEIKARILNEKEEAKKEWKKYKQHRYLNGETDIEVVTRLIHQLRKRKTDWSPNQITRRKVAQWIEELEEVIQCYNHVRILREIYDSRACKTIATEEFKWWISKGRKLWKKILEVKNMTRMINNRLDSITNYFISRSTNWYAEWLNSRIQRLISYARWFRNMNYTIFRIIKLFW